MNSTAPPDTGSPNNVPALPFTPALAPNAVFLTIFVLLLAAQLVLAVRYWRFYGYAIGMVSGLLLESLGYVAKVQLAHNRKNKSAYIMYIIGLTLGPTFLSSALYLGIAALQKHCGARRFGCIGPRLFATLFILGDFACLCFIGVGGSLSVIYASKPTGVDLMIAGLATQALCTAVFCLLLALISREMQTRMTGYMISAAIASTCLLLRSCWRVAELSDGFNGPLASKEGIFIALDSLPMIIMSLLLTALHPRLWFASMDNTSKRGAWTCWS